MRASFLSSRLNHACDAYSSSVYKVPGFSNHGTEIAIGGYLAAYVTASY